MRERADDRHWQGGRYRYYRCSRRLRRGEAVCPRTSMRDKALEAIVVDALAERLLHRERLRALFATILDDSSAAVRERQARLKALRAERTRVEGAIQNMFDFIEQGIVSPRDGDFTGRLAAQRARRVDLEQEIVLVERQLSSPERQITTEAVNRLGEVILGKLRSPDSKVRQGHARRIIDRIVAAPDTITISGPVKPLALATFGNPDQSARMVPSSDREWCGREDSNFHGLSATTTSTLRVYQFRHDRTSRRSPGRPGALVGGATSRAFSGPQWLRHQ